MFSRKKRDVNAPFLDETVLVKVYISLRVTNPQEVSFVSSAKLTVTVLFGKIVCVLFLSVMLREELVCFHVLRLVCHLGNRTCQEGQKSIFICTNSFAFLFTELACVVIKVVDNPWPE